MATVMVALLRGVNVGAATQVPMADLRRVVEGCGFADVRTYVNSGNVVLSSDDRDGEAVAGRLRDACAEAFPSVRPDVVVRTAAELRSVVAGNPFLDRDDDPTHHHVVFLPGPGPAVAPDLDLAPFHPEDLAVGDREVYLFLPGGMGRSRLAQRLATLKGPAGTSRNWRTVTRLSAMADGA